MVNNLRAIRQAQGLSQKAVAALAGVAPNLLTRVESSESEPYYETRVKLAAALNVTIQDIWPGYKVPEHASGIAEWQRIGTADLKRLEAIERAASGLIESSESPSSPRVFVEKRALDELRALVQGGKQEGN